MNNNCYVCKYRKEVGTQWDYHYRCDHPSHKFIIGQDEDTARSSVCNDYSPNYKELERMAKDKFGFRGIR
ncbi:MAG: hypothetical protein ACRC6V_09200 [Bacteroidales bacterium]